MHACAAALLLAACGPGPVGDRPADPAAADPPTTWLAEDLPACDDAIAAEIVVDTIASGLEVPWDFAFLPDGRVLVTERAGRVRVIRDGQLETEPWAEFDLYAQGEAGLLGIDVAPDFDRTGHVYVAGTVPSGRGRRDRVFNLLRRLIGRHTDHVTITQVIRYTDRDGRGTDPRVIEPGISAGPIHVGGALRFGPDGRLHLGTGDASVPALAADRRERAGAIIAYLHGRPHIVASGLRNVQGLAWQDGRMLALDHGPTGMVQEDRRTGLDELNVIEPGGDYGWPDEAGRVDEPRFRPPLIQWTEAIAPAGLAVHEGDLWIAALAARALIRVEMKEGVPQCTSRALDGHGRIRAIRTAPDGSLWIGTSNRDGRGRAEEKDDLVLRLSRSPVE